MPEFYSKGVKFHYEVLGQDQGPVFVWGHGWGQSHKSFLALVESLKSLGRHILIDFPGFGGSSLPLMEWGTRDYADAISEWLRAENIGPIVWAGHSFGGRVGIQLAGHHPQHVAGLILIAGAGLKRTRSLPQKIYYKFRIWTFKAIKIIVLEGRFKEKLTSKFGSADYKNAGPLRPLFVRIVNEDLTEDARRIQCPTALIYGSGDTEAPPEFGERFSKLIPKAELFLLDGQDHYTVLSTGRHQVAKIINDLIQKIKS